MTPPAPSRLRRLSRRLCRWLFLLVLVLVLALGSLALFLNQVGLPDPVKKRLVAELKAQGWEVEFTQMRLRWRRGIVVEDLRLQRAHDPAGPQLFLDRAECRLDPAALRRLELEVEAVKLEGGRLLWRFSGTNGVRTSFRLNEAVGELLFRPGDQWELRSLEASLLGIHVHVSGLLSHASYVRDWKFPKRDEHKPLETDAWWRQTADTLNRIKFAETPELSATFQADARRLQDLEATLTFRSQALASPWGSGANVLLVTRVSPPASSNAWLQASLRLTADQARTPWGEAGKLRLNWENEPSFRPWNATHTHLSLDLRNAQSRWAQADRLLVAARFDPSATNAALMQSDITASATRLRTAWGQTTNAELKATLIHSFTNFLPADASADLRLDETQTRWGQAAHARLQTRGSLPTARDLAPGPSTNPWPRSFDRLPGNVHLAITGLVASDVQAEEITLRSEWNRPVLSLEGSARVAGGRLSLQTGLDLLSRACTFQGLSECDLRLIAPLFSTNAQPWLAPLEWTASPRVEAAGSIVLPAWTNPPPRWREESLPTLAVAGKFAVGAGAYHGVPFNSASSPFSFSNMTWRISDLLIARPEGAIQADYSADERTRDFQCRVRSQIDPKIVKPLLAPEHQRAFDFVEFKVPPYVEGTIRGRWKQPETLDVALTVRATNFSIRGETARSGQARLLYTNQFISILNPEVRRDGERGGAQGLGIDLVAQKLYFTNASGNLNPQAVTRAIGKKTAEAIEPYRFEVSPEARAHGVVDLKRGRHEDAMVFEVKGGAFHWKNFHLSALSGVVDWQGLNLRLGDVQGTLHGGQVTGAARFDFAPPTGTEFSFNTLVREVNLSPLMADLAGQTNRIEGLLSGELVIDHANDLDPASWQGHGRLRLRDGLLWEIPIFGVFSPVLNTLIPGLGSSRAKDATAGFLITNSVIRSKNLQIHATAMRMQYEGSVDFERRVEARMEAELLRDLPGIGFFLSKVFWPVTKLFEYKVSGTLDKPKTEPLYIIPKILLAPLRPFKTIREMLPEESKKPPEKPAK